MKYIQLFTKLPEQNTDNCEVSAKLIKLESHKDDYYLLVKESDNSKWEYYFPKWNVSMIRISHE